MTHAPHAPFTFCERGHFLSAAALASLALETNDIRGLIVADDAFALSNVQPLLPPQASLTTEVQSHSEEELSNRETSKLYHHRRRHHDIAVTIAITITIANSSSSAAQFGKCLFLFLLPL